MSNVKYVGAMPMMKNLPRESHLSVHGGFFEYAQENLSPQRLYDIRFYEMYVPLYQRLVAANTKTSLKSVMEKRDAHIEDADKYFALINQNIMLKTRESDDATIISDANILKDIIVPYKSLTNKSIKDKITKYRNLINKLAEYPDSINELNIKHLCDKLSAETEEADKASDEIILSKAKNNEYRLTDIRPQIDTVYRNAMDYLNNRWAVEGNDFECKEFMLNWSKKIDTYKSQYAISEGIRLAAKQRKELENEESEVVDGDKKNKKYYTLPKSRKIRFVDINAGRIVSTPLNDQQEKYPNAKEWKVELNMDSWQNGDIAWVFVGGKKVYYELIDRRSIDIDPLHEEWEAAWKLLE
jgi:hypothetical protein